MLRHLVLLLVLWANAAATSVLHRWPTLGNAISLSPNAVLKRTSSFLENTTATQPDNATTLVPFTPCHSTSVAPSWSPTTRAVATDIAVPILTTRISTPTSSLPSLPTDPSTSERWTVVVASTLFIASAVGLAIAAWIFGQRSRRHSEIGSERPRFAFQPRYLIPQGPYDVVLATATFGADASVHRRLLLALHLETLRALEAGGSNHRRSEINSIDSDSISSSSDATEDSNKS